MSAATAQNIPQLFGHYIVHTISYSLIFDISPYSNNLGMRILVSSNSANYTMGSFLNSYTISILWDGFDYLQSSTQWNFGFWWVFFKKTKISELQNEVLNKPGFDFGFENQTFSQVLKSEQKWYSTLQIYTSRKRWSSSHSS